MSGSCGHGYITAALCGVCAPLGRVRRIELVWQTGPGNQAMCAEHKVTNQATEQRHVFTALVGLESGAFWFAQVFCDGRTFHTTEHAESGEAKTTCAEAISRHMHFLKIRT